MGNELMNFLEWLGSSEVAVVAERDAQLAYARNFAVVTAFIQATALLFIIENYPTAAVLAVWSLFLALCLGSPPAPRFLPKASTPRGHQWTGVAMTLLGMGIQAMLIMVVYTKVMRLA